MARRIETDGDFRGVPGFLLIPRRASLARLCRRGLLRDLRAAGRGHLLCPGEPWGFRRFRGRTSPQGRPAATFLPPFYPLISANLPLQLVEDLVDGGVHVLGRIVGLVPLAAARHAGLDEVQELLERN